MAQARRALLFLWETQAKALPGPALATVWRVACGE